MCISLHFYAVLLVVCACASVCLCVRGFMHVCAGTWMSMLKPHASHEHDWAAITGIYMVTQVKILCLSPSQVSESLRQEAGVELNPYDERASIDSCVTELNCVVSSVSQGTHTHIQTQNKYHSTLTNRKKQTRQILLSLPPESNDKVTVILRQLPRKADGETVPLLRETMTLIPVSTNGTEKSMTSERSSLIVRDPTAMTAFL